MPKSPKPSPVIVETICSMCALNWQEHGDNPTTEDCIRLLNAELAKKPQPRQYWWYPNIQTYPSIAWQQPYYYNLNNTTGTVSTNTANVTAVYSTPAVSKELPKAS